MLSAAACTLKRCAGPRLERPRLLNQPILPPQNTGTSRNTPPIALTPSLPPITVTGCFAPTRVRRVQPTRRPSAAKPAAQKWQPRPAASGGRPGPKAALKGAVADWRGGRVKPSQAALTTRDKASSRQTVSHGCTHATAVSTNIIDHIADDFRRRTDDPYRPNAAIQIWIVSADAGMKSQLVRRGIENPARQPPQNAHGAYECHLRRRQRSSWQPVQPL